MSSNPYENEPGFENARSPSDKKNMASYVAKVDTPLGSRTLCHVADTDQIRHETLRVAVIQRLEESLGIQTDGTVEPPSEGCWDPAAEAEIDEEDKLMFEDDRPAFEPFKDLCKRRFLWYYESYVLAIEAAEKRVKEGDKFEKMPFEGGGNSMDGHFHYTELKRRLAFIKETIGQETDRWAIEGLAATKKEVGIAANLQRQHEQIVENYKNRKNFTLDLALEDGNPFIWQITYFGRPMTHLEGGLFRIRVSLSPRFPEEQPRVLVQTQIFHNRISKDGVLCYFPKKQEEMKSHIEAIVEALEEESPPYDPRTTVNPEASKLFWGSADDKKKYNRSLRRSVQRSTE